jgi:hypothetical protein
MRAKTIVSALAGTICTALVIAGVAWAAKATTTVKMFGPDQVYGSIHSPSKHCVGGRTVKIFKEKGSTPNPSVDTYTKNHTTSASDGSWDMGTLGLRHGRYYALATKTTACKRGISNVVVAH